jgi:hypothetical protein
MINFYLMYIVELFFFCVENLLPSWGGDEKIFDNFANSTLYTSYSTFVLPRLTFKTHIKLRRKWRHEPGFVHIFFYRSACKIWFDVDSSKQSDYYFMKIFHESLIWFYYCENYFKDFQNPALTCIIRMMGPSTTLYSKTK